MEQTAKPSTGKYTFLFICSIILIITLKYTFLGFYILAMITKKEKWFYFGHVGAICTSIAMITKNESVGIFVTLIILIIAIGGFFYILSQYKNIIKDALAIALEKESNENIFNTEVNKDIAKDTSNIFESAKMVNEVYSNEEVYKDDKIVEESVILTDEKELEENVADSNIKIKDGEIIEIKINFINEEELSTLDNINVHLRMKIYSERELSGYYVSVDEFFNRNNLGRTPENIELAEKMNFSIPKS